MSIGFHMIHFFSCLGSLFLCVLHLMEKIAVLLRQLCIKLRILPRSKSIFDKLTLVKIRCCLPRIIIPLALWQHRTFLVDLLFGLQILLKQRVMRLV